MSTALIFGTMRGIKIDSIEECTPAEREEYIQRLMDIAAADELGMSYEEIAANSGSLALRGGNVERTHMLDGSRH